MRLAIVIRVKWTSVAGEFKAAGIQKLELEGFAAVDRCHAIIDSVESRPMRRADMPNGVMRSRLPTWWELLCQHHRGVSFIWLTFRDLFHNVRLIPRRFVSSHCAVNLHFKVLDRSGCPCVDIAGPPLCQCH